MFYGPSDIPYGPLAMPMSPFATGSGYGQPNCGCVQSNMLWGGDAGMMIGGGYVYGGPVDPRFVHFGPGYHRYTMEGHVRYPYYSYRRPWYTPGHPSFNRDLNLPW
jgi:hypothetical protein